MNDEHASLINFLADLSEQCDVFLMTRNDVLGHDVIYKIKMMLMSSAYIAQADANNKSGSARNDTHR